MAMPRLPAGLAGAGARAAITAAQNALPQVVRDVQRLLDFSDSVARPVQGGQAVDIQNVPMALLGGATLARARQVHETIRDARLARKNLWFIRVTDPNPPVEGVSAGGVIDLLSLEVSYSPLTMAAEKINIGAAVFDRMNGSEPVELSLTVMDDEAGTVKQWFRGKCLQAAHPEGTFGLPAEYCVNIQIVHAISDPYLDTQSPPYKDFMTMRPQAIQLDLSRREAAMQELVLSFSEFDTFISNAGGIA